MLSLTLGNLAELAVRFGPRWCLFRAGLAVQRRLGWLERTTPARPWDGWPSPPSLHLTPLRSSPSCFLDAEATAELATEAEEIAAGVFRLFGHERVEAGLPPSWNVNLSSGRRVQTGVHWSRLADLDAGAGDVKYVWELSRFRWAWVLARMHRATGDPKWGTVFWRLWEDWRDANQPNRGPQWMCGQECSVRTIALASAIYAFADHPESTTGRMIRLQSAIGVHAARIDAHIGYALSQNNNHGIGEAAGLWTAGLISGWHPDARAWRERGHRLLEEQGLRQFYADGAYVQHSISYHRFALQYYLWALELGRASGESFSRELRERLRVATRFLSEVTDPESGSGPLYGGCDSSDLFGLSEGNRNFVARMTRALDEAEPRVASKTSKLPSIYRADQGGYYVLRLAGSWAFLRCHTYRDRPAHADMLHLDLWSGGQCIAGDSGSYSYNCEPPWDGWFASTGAHNTVQVDGLDQMQRGPRFLWFRWTRAAVRHALANQTAAYFEGEHYGYAEGAEPVVHRRAVLALDGIWIVVDDLLGAGAHRFVLRWNLSGEGWMLNREGGAAVRTDWTVRVHCPGASSRLAIGETSPPEGWVSPRYGERIARPVLLTELAAQAPVRFITAIYPSAGEAPELAPGYLQLAGKSCRRFDLSACERGAERILGGI